MALDDRAEAPHRQLVPMHLAVGLDDQGHLPEGLAGAELADLLAVDRHGHLAALDHDEGAARLSLLSDRLAGGVRPFDELAAQAVEKRVIGLGEEGNAAK